MKEEVGESERGSGRERLEEKGEYRNMNYKKGRVLNMRIELLWQISVSNCVLLKIIMITYTRISVTMLNMHHMSR